MLRLVDVTALSRPVERMLPEGMIQPARTDETLPSVVEHAAEPIKDADTLVRISLYLVNHRRYRDNMLFVVGINFGLRVSDLLSLRFNTLIDESMVFRTTFPILEKKTRNTRKVRKNRYITINDAVIEAVTLYLRWAQYMGMDVSLDDYLFRSESNNGSGKNQPLSRMAVDNILKGIARDCGLVERISSHTLRKTFGYHQMLMSGNDPRKLLLLQKIFGHSTSAQTLEYIGITEEEIEDAYLSLNLGTMKRESGTIGELKEA